MSTQQTSQENPLAGFGPNEWIVEEMYQRYLADPSSVDSAWHDFFADYRPNESSGVTASPTTTGGAAANHTAEAQRTEQPAKAATPAPTTPSAAPSAAAPAAATPATSAPEQYAN